ncbi:MAG TPA: DCC1-like thiol-disulfide oxidoreductase family protein [Allocoleopsis sp.]
MNYYVIFDGNCNLCVTLVQFLEKLDQGKIFSYFSMQDEENLQKFGITAQDCELGMILINQENPAQRWQGSNAAEEIGKLLPGGEIFVNVYRQIPGVKWIGDLTYTQIRDHRYTLFGKRTTTYQSIYPICTNNNCNFSNQ